MDKAEKGTDEIGVPSGGAPLDAGNAVTYRDARQTAAAIEGPTSDDIDAVRYRDTRQAGAFLKGVIEDSCNTVRNSVIGLFFVF